MARLGRRRVVSCTPTTSALYIWRARATGVGHFDSTPVVSRRDVAPPPAREAVHSLTRTHIRAIFLSDLTTKLAYFSLLIGSFEALVGTTWRLQPQAVKLAVP